MNTKEILQKIIDDFKSEIKGLLIATGPFILVATSIMYFSHLLLNDLNSYLISFSILFVSFVLDAFITLVGLKYFLNKQSVSISITKSNLFTYCFSTAYISIAASIGYLFFIIPGIFISCISFFYPIFIIKDNQGPIQAIESSIDIIRNNLKQMLLLYFIITLVLVAIEYITSHVFNFIPLPFQTNLIFIDLISHVMTLIYIPFMLVVYNLYTENSSTSNTQNAVL